MKVYVMLADGFEEIEALAVVDVLRRGKVETVMASVKRDKIVSSARNIPVIADSALENIHVDPEDMIVLPGGLNGVRGLEASEELIKILKEHQARKGWLAAICAAPSIPGKLGFYEGCRATCYPGLEDELKGAIVSDDEVVVDKNFITSRGPGTAFQFSFSLLSVIKGEQAAVNLKEAMLYK